jgi:hypothetical protein
MTMYLPNNYLRPTGSEVAEFIDAQLVADDRGAGARRAQSHGLAGPTATAPAPVTEERDAQLDVTAAGQ